jgi:hypothetical protein
MMETTVGVEPTVGEVTMVAMEGKAAPMMERMEAMSMTVVDEHDGTDAEANRRPPEPGVVYIGGIRRRIDLDKLLRLPGDTLGDPLVSVGLLAGLPGDGLWFAVDDRLHGIVAARRIVRRNGHGRLGDDRLLRYRHAACAGQKDAHEDDTAPHPYLPVASMLLRWSNRLSK